jgi:hypothetical protein
VIDLKSPQLAADLDTSMAVGELFTYKNSGTPTITQSRTFTRDDAGLWHVTFHPGKGDIRCVQFTYKFKGASANGGGYDGLKYRSYSRWLTVKESSVPGLFHYTGGLKQVTDYEATDLRTRTVNCPTTIPQY